MSTDRDPSEPPVENSVIEGELIQRDGTREYRYQWRESSSQGLDLGALTPWQRARLYGRLALLVLLGLAVLGALLFGAFMIAGVGLVVLLVGWVVLKVFGRGPVVPRMRPPGRPR